MASISKHRDKYQVRVRRKGYPTISKSFHRHADAKEWARMMETKADRQELSPDSKTLKSIALADLVRRYRDTVLPGKKCCEVETIILNAFLRHPICKKTLNDLTVSDFARYRDDRLSGKHGIKAITPKTIKRTLSPVHRMFEVAMSEWDIPLRRNPLADFKMKVTDNKRQRRLLEGELDKLLSAAKANRNPYVVLVVRFALETAMRRGEILALQWRDIDSERRLATVRESKNGHARIIPLSSVAIDALKASASLSDGDDDDMVFPVSANALKLSWARLVKRAGLPDFHFHDLRHEAISRLFEHGLTVPEVASISGHVDPRMLFRYAHANHASIRAKLLAAE